MTFKAKQWVVVDTTVSYWPDFSKDKKGPFKISHIDVGGQGKYAVLEKAPNNAYFQHLTLYKPQVGDKVKILSVMCGMQVGGQHDFTGKIGTITEMCPWIGPEGEKSLGIDGWYYKDKEGETYELVEPKGSINTTAPEPPFTPVVKPTKRVLNDNV